MLLSLTIIGLYVWSNFFAGGGAHNLTVGLPAAILSLITAILSVLTYFKTPSDIFKTSLAIYWLNMLTAVVLIISSGGVASPFITIWMLIGLFAALYGAWSLIPIMVISAIFVAIEYVSRSLAGNALLIIFVSLIPIMAGVFMWRDKSEKDELNSDNKAFRNLANELSEVASKSEVVINAIGDGVMAIDNKGVIQLINPAAQAIIGWGKQDAMGLNYKSVLQLVDIKNEVIDTNSDPIQQALNINQQIRSNDLNLVTRTGKKLIISLVVSPVSEVGSGVIAVFRDITKEKAEEREQAEFISTASHEMRTPVASIEGYLGLAVNPNTAQVDDRARDFILKAHASAQHLGRLFQDLLDVSKADDGRVSNNPKVIDIVPFLHEIVQGLEPKATAKGLRLIYKPVPDGTREKHIAPVYYVNLDNDHVREIMNNLVENAIKYTLTGDVIVDIKGDDDHIVISIKDSGIGIPAEDMPHLFQKFYRVDDENTRIIGGTGLGLYLCRRLSEIMGGRIWAESVYNSGSTFYVEFPRVSSQEATQLLEQEAFKARQEAAQVSHMAAGSQPQAAAVTMPAYIPPSQPVQLAPQPVTPIQIAPYPAPVGPSPAGQPITASPSDVPHKVPRTQALTPEQIAAYVAKQRALAMQQAVPQPGMRPAQSVAVPTRGQQS